VGKIGIGIGKGIGIKTSRATVLRPRRERLGSPGKKNWRERKNKNKKSGRKNRRRRTAIPRNIALTALPEKQTFVRRQEPSEKHESERGVR
jgi:hypothetical protein